MGYQSVNTEKFGSGKKDFIGATFAKVSGSHENVKLGELKPNELFQPMADVISRINQLGGTLQAFIYLNAEYAAIAQGMGYEDMVEGWYDFTEFTNWVNDNFTYAIPCYNETVTLNEGEALMIEAAFEGAGIMFSGEVDQEDIELVTAHPGGGNKSFVCNCTPVDITLGRILPNDMFQPMADVISLMNELGGTEQAFIYLNAEYAAIAQQMGYEDMVEGWYDFTEFTNWVNDNFTYAIPCYNSTIVRSGRGLRIEAAFEGAGIIIPSAL